MGSAEVPRKERRRKAIEELRCNKVGILLQIIDKLEGMNLSVLEIETVLKTCGLNDDCAARFGASISDEKKRGHASSDQSTHP